MVTGSLPSKQVVGILIARTMADCGAITPLIHAGWAFSRSNKEIRVSVQTHPTASAENILRRRIYVPFADVASLDGDGGAERRIGWCAGCGRGQHPDLYRKGQ